MYHLYYAVVLASLFIHCQCDVLTQNRTQCNVKCDGKENASTLLNMATDFLNKSKLFFPDCISDDLNCGKCEKSLAFLEVGSNLMSKAKEILPTCPEPEIPEPVCPKPECPEPVCPEKPERPMDCSEILLSGKKESGVYTIWPRSRVSSKQPLSVYCDMDTDGGGWTVIQRRGRFSTPKDYFYKDWESYKTGFGDIKEEFWLGNENIHAICKQGNNAIRFDLVDAGGATGYAQYETFWIEDETASYTSHIGGYKGTVGDGMKLNNNMKFSTKDRDNDKWAQGSCSVDRQGAWWYNHCANANLNALNQPGVNSWKGMHWYQWRDSVSLARVEIKLRHERIQL